MNTHIAALELSPAPAGRSSAVPKAFRIGPSIVHRDSGLVESSQGERRLRLMELELIIHLYAHVTQTFSREKLLRAVWNCRPDLATRTVDQTMATLRKKIEPEPDRPRFLQTVYGTGYRLML